MNNDHEMIVEENDADGDDEEIKPISNEDFMKRMKEHYPNASTRFDDIGNLNETASILSETTQTSEISEFETTTKTNNENGPNNLPPNNDESVNILDLVASKRCKICDKYFNTPTKLVAHYVRDHPDADVYISRITPTYGSLVKNGTFDAIIADKKIKSVCPFCEKVESFVQSKWITHFTHHTGEYEYKCNKCKQLITTSKHDKCRSNATKINDFSMENNLFKAYVCRACNFTKLIRNDIEIHVENQHPGANIDETIIQFDLLKTNQDDKTVDKPIENVKREQLSQTNEDVQSNETISVPIVDENSVDFDAMAAAVEAGLEENGLKCEEIVADMPNEIQKNGKWC